MYLQSEEYTACLAFLYNAVRQGCYRSASRRPRQLLAAQHVDVQVIHALTALGPVVDDRAVALGKALLLGDMRRRPHAVTQHRFVLLSGVGQPREPVADLRNHQEVRGRLRVDVAECHARLILPRPPRQHEHVSDQAG